MTVEVAQSEGKGRRYKLICFESHCTCCLSVVGGKCSKTDKVVKREVCSIQTKGTKRLSFIDGDSTDCCSQFLLALCEKVTVTVVANCFV